METKAEKLERLDAAFDSADNKALGQMSLGVFLARRSLILAEPDPPPAPKAAPPVPKPVATQRKYVTQRLLKGVLDELGDVVREHVAAKLAPIEEHVRGASHRLDAHNARLDELERRMAEIEREGTKRWPKAV